jgi:hypothetical protein
MWLITTQGFLSVVQNLNSTGPDDALLVRGRVRADLGRFADFAARRDGWPAVVESPDADYGFRLTTSREVLAAFVAEHVASLDYPNFKGEIYKADPVREKVYEDAWPVLDGLKKVRS